MDLKWLQWAKRIQAICSLNSFMILGKKRCLINMKRTFNLNVRLFIMVLCKLNA